MTEYRIALSAPDIGKAEQEAVARVLASGQLSRGVEVERFETLLAAQCGAAGAVAVNSGTSALQLALASSGIGPGDEVVLPAFTFVAPANAIAHCGARPVLADVEPDTLNLDPRAVECVIGKRTRALLPVHTFGRPADLAPLLNLAGAHDLTVIEDACEALGSQWADQPVGALGRAGVFGFYPNKAVTAGEAGAVVSNDTELLANCRALRNQGRDDGSELSRMAGHSFRLSELHAALGRVQLERAEDLLADRRRVADIYRQCLADVEGIQLPPLDDERHRTGWFVFVIRLQEATAGDRDRLRGMLAEDGIQCGAYFPPLYHHPAFRHLAGRTRGFPIAEAAAAATLALPFHTRLAADDIDYVCERLRCRLTQSRGGTQSASV
ncbi:MAG: DegT/DnrJ/EryC1/StrS family aminotransferase [Gammaproteobacteria bacterium]|jgi:perosamine synthetase